MGFTSDQSNLHIRLDLNQFLRIHRTLILNKFYIKQCTYMNNNVYKFKLKNDVEVLSSRSFSSQIAEYLSLIK